MEDWDPGTRCGSMSMSEYNINLEEALAESRRWIEAVTGKRFKYIDYRKSVADGVLFCELMQNIKRGSIKKINRLPTTFAGMDNLNIFLKACEKEFGLSGSQLFHAGDLQDLSHRASFTVPERKKELERRLKNVCITLYWLGKKARKLESFVGPQLNLDVFTTLIFDGTSSLKDTSSSGVSSMDSGDPTNNNRFSFGGCEDVFGPDGALDFSNIAPKTYKEPEWKRSLSRDIEPEELVTVQAVVQEEASIQLEAPTGFEESISVDTEEAVFAAVPRSRMERRMHPHALKPHMRSQSVPEQMLSQNTGDEDQEMWMSSLSSWKSRRIRATSTERSRKALQEEVQEIEQTRVRRKSKTYKEIVEEKERREKELQEEWDRIHGVGSKPPKAEKEDRQELERIMTNEPLGYGSDGEQNNNKEEVYTTPMGKVRPRTLPKSFKQKKARPTILKPEAVTATSAPQEEQSLPVAPSDPHKQKLRRRYGSAFQPYLRSSTGNGTVDTVDASNRASHPMSFHDKLIQEREQDREMAAERRDIHAKSKEVAVRKPKLSVGIMSRVRAFDRGEADIPKQVRPQMQAMRQRSMSRPFSEMTVCINQRPRSETGFGFAVEGGVDKEKPIVVTQVESGGPADLSELREKDEIVAINGEKVKPFTNDDFKYCISQAVLSGSLTLKVRRYDDEGIKVRQSTSRRYSDLIPTSKSDTAPENQSTDPTEVISPSRAREMFTQMEQKQRALSPDSQRSLSPKHRQTTPSPKLQENHKPKEGPPQENLHNQAEIEVVDQSMPYKEIERPIEPAHSPSTSPFSSPDEAEDQDKSWVKEKKPEPTPQVDDRPKPKDVELKIEPPPVFVKEPDTIAKGDATKTKDDLEWLENLEAIEKEAFGFIDSQGTEEEVDLQERKEERNKPEETLRAPDGNQQLCSSEEERMEDEIMLGLEEEEKKEEQMEARHRAIEDDELNKSAVKESPILKAETQTVESSMPIDPPQPVFSREPPQPVFSREPPQPVFSREPPQPVFSNEPPQQVFSSQPPQPLFKVPASTVPLTNLGPKPYKPMAPEPYRRPAQPVFLREKDIRERVKADMHKRRSDFFSKSLDFHPAPVYGNKASPSSSGRTSPVDEPLTKSMEDLWPRVEQLSTESQPEQPAQPVPSLQPQLRQNSRPRSIHGMPTRKTFNLEEERRRLEKWQAEQERLRQEQYEQEQRRLQEQRERDLQKAEEEEKKRLEAEQRAIEERQKKLQQQAEERLRLAREEEERERLEQERLEKERQERERLAQEALEAEEQYPPEPVEEVIQPQNKQEDFAMPSEDPHKVWQREQEERERLEREREKEEEKAREQERERLQKEREEQEAQERERERLQKEREEQEALERERERLQKEREEQEWKAREMERVRQQKMQESEQEQQARLREEEIERIRAEEREKLRREWQELQRERALQEEREKQEVERLQQLRAEQERLRQERMLLEKQQAEERRQLELEKERLRKLAAQPMPLGSNKPQEDKVAGLPQEEIRAPVKHTNPFHDTVEHTNPFHGAGDAPANKPVLSHQQNNNQGKTPEPSLMSKYKDDDAQPQQHWLVEEAERRRIAEKTGTGRASPFIQPKDTVDNEPMLEKKTYKPEESAPPPSVPNANGTGKIDGKDPKYPLDPPTRIAPPMEPHGGGDYDMPSHPYESQPIMRRPRRKEADAEKQRKIQNRRSMPDIGNRDASRTVGGEMTPPLGQGSAPPPEAISQSISYTESVMPLQVGDPHPAYYGYAVNTQMIKTEVVNTQGVMMVAPIPYSAAYATYNWETAPQEQTYAYDPEDFTARNATAATQDTSSPRYDSDGNEML